MSRLMHDSRYRCVIHLSKGIVMPTPQPLTPGRFETLTAHRPDLALWLQHQRGGDGS